MMIATCNGRRFDPVRQLGAAGIRHSRSFVRREISFPWPQAKLIDSEMLRSVNLLHVIGQTFLVVLAKSRDFLKFLEHIQPSAANHAATATPRRLGYCARL